MDQLSAARDNVSNAEPFQLKAPNVVFRLAWLLAGLVMGYIASRVRLPSISLFIFIATLAGLSANWST